MNDINPTPEESADPLRRETDAERRRRIAREASMIAQADAEIDAGLYVGADDVDAWIDSIGTAKELPPPPTRRT